MTQQEIEKLAKWMGWTLKTERDCTDEYRSWYVDANNKWVFDCDDDEAATNFFTVSGGEKFIVEKLASMDLAAFVRMEPLHGTPRFEASIDFRDTIVETDLNVDKCVTLAHVLSLATLRMIERGE